MISRSMQLDDHVIYLDFNLFMHHIMEQSYHGWLISPTYVLQIKWHDIIGISPPMGSACWIYPLPPS